MKTTALRHTGLRAVTGLVMVMAATLLLALLGAGRGPNAGDFPLPVFSRFGAILAEDLPTRWPFLGDNVESAKKPRASLASYDASPVERPVIAGASRGEILAPDFRVSADPEPVLVAGPVTVVAASERDDLSTRQTSAIGENGTSTSGQTEAKTEKPTTTPATRPTGSTEAKQKTSAVKKTSASKSSAKPAAVAKKPSSAMRTHQGGKALAKGHQKHELKSKATKAQGHRLQRPSAAGHRQTARAQKHVTKPSEGRAAQHPSVGHPAKRAVR